MALFYFDTSALVKHYVREPGSAWVRELIDAHVADSAEPLHTIVMCAASITEVAAALAILHRRRIIRRRQHDAAYNKYLTDLDERFALVDISLADFYSAAELARNRSLKAYDAVQLAVALRQARATEPLGINMIFVSGDTALLAAAQAEGLTTDNPFDHLTPLD